MFEVTTLFFYTLVFISVYVQVFLLVTFLENRKKIVIRKGETTLTSYPAVTIVVPCWNEEKTVEKTVNSLLAVNYPADKLNIFLVDDGSTDGTAQVLEKFRHHSNVTIFQKENGGKHSALNLGLANTETEFLGCLDADSTVHREALARLIGYFETDKEAMAVVPSVTVTGAKNVIQNAQEAEYHMGVYMKKMLDFLGAINVTPGPFTIFRKKVFDDLGPYKHAHNTEDMEIAYRMQTHNYKIVHCNDAFVYTGSPSTIRALYKQRLRWVYGFINNTIDYRKTILRKRYGNFALFTLPTGVVSLIAIFYLFFSVISDLFGFLHDKVVHFQVVGFSGGSGLSASIDPFFMSMEMSLFLVVLIYSGVAFAVMFGQKMVEKKFRLSMNMLYFLVIFRVVAPFWIMKAIYNTIVSRRAPNWR